MGRRGPKNRLILARSRALLLALVVLAAPACGGSKSDGHNAVTLRPDRVVGHDVLEQTAGLVEARLKAAGYADAKVDVVVDWLRVRSPRDVDPPVLRAVTRRGALTFRLVLEQLPPGKTCTAVKWRDADTQNGCYELGPTLLSGVSVRSARATREAGDWGVDVTFAGTDFTDKVAKPHVNQRIAIVVDHTVFSAPTISPGITGRIVRISGRFVEGEARGLAAVLDAHAPLPVGFVWLTYSPPSTVARIGDAPYANTDHWHAALGVNVCGRWLANAPAFEDREGTSLHAGLHSHGDGLVHVHPFYAAEAGANATLGRFLEYGGWFAGTDRLRLWDAQIHTSGNGCAGKPARVRWSVDGRERHGDPSRLRLENQQVIVLAFLPPDAPIGTPPQVKALAGPGDQGPPVSVP
jgi:hypothetical protein